MTVPRLSVPFLSLPAPGRCFVLTSTPTLIHLSTFKKVSNTGCALIAAYHGILGQLWLIMANVESLRFNAHGHWVDSRPWQPLPPKSPPALICMCNAFPAKSWGQREVDIHSCVGPCSTISHYQVLPSYPFAHAFSLAFAARAARFTGSCMENGDRHAHHLSLELEAWYTWYLDVGWRFQCHSPQPGPTNPALTASHRRNRAQGTPFSPHYSGAAAALPAPSALTPGDAEDPTQKLLGNDGNNIE